MCASNQSNKGEYEFARLRMCARATTPTANKMSWKNPRRVRVNANDEVRFVMKVRNESMCEMRDKCRMENVTTEGKGSERRQHRRH